MRCEPRALRCKPIEIRRADQPVAIAAEDIAGMIVGKNVYEIRPAIARFACATCGNRLRGKGHQFSSCQVHL